MSNFLKKSVYGLYKFIILLIIVVLLFAKVIPYNPFHKRPFIAPNFILLPVGIGLLYLLKGLVSEKLASKVKLWMVMAVTFALSLVVAYGAMFITGWDAGNIFNDAVTVVHGGSVSPDYYSTYPNNRLIVIILVSLIRTAMMFGLESIRAVYGLIVLVQCVLFCLTGVMVHDYLLMTLGKKAAVCGALIFAFYVAMSPFVYIVYTDALGVIFPVLLLWLSKKIPDEKVVIKFAKWMLIILAAVIGYYLKAPAFIVYIALVLSFIIYHIFKRDRERFVTDILAVIMMLVVGLGMMKLSSAIITDSFEKITQVKCNDEGAISVYHYLMMGANDETDGTVNMDDVEFSESFSSYDERIVQNKIRFKERFDQLFPGKLLYLYTRKLALNFNDGSFGYAISGRDFIAQEVISDNSINKYIRKVYWPGRGNYLYIINVSQVIWLGLLFWSFFNKSKEESDYSLRLAIIGAVLFTTIFEAQARYLFIWSPIILIAAVEGLYNKVKR